MAMSTGTMSNNPNEWLQFYSQNLNSTPLFGLDSESTVVTATTASAAAPPGQGGSVNPTSGTNSLSPDQGRISKPVRKRSRASRRTPTTLLNTDTSNFRAMVQQFTGGPSTTPFPSGSAHHAGGSSFSFGMGPRPQSFLVAPGYNPLQQQQQQQQLQQQHQYQQYLLPLNNTNNGSGDGFLQRLSSSAAAAAARVGPTNMGLGVSISSDLIHDDGFLREGGGGAGGVTVSSQVPNSNSSNSNENRSNSFMF